MEKINFGKAINMKAFLYNELGACGCSELSEILRVLCKFFVWIEQEFPTPYESLFASRGVYYIVAGTCEKADLIEHGISVRAPFLTVRGENFAAAMKVHTGQQIEEARGEAYDGCWYAGLLAPRIKRRSFV